MIVLDVLRLMSETHTSNWRGWSSFTPHTRDEQSAIVCSSHSQSNAIGVTADLLEKVELTDPSYGMALSGPLADRDGDMPMAVVAAPPADAAGLSAESKLQGNAKLSVAVCVAKRRGEGGSGGGPP